MTLTWWDGYCPPVPGDLFAAAGSLRSVYDAVDWSRGPLGPVSSWSRPLRTAVSLALSTRFPVSLFWGADLVMIYNEAYAEVIADKHPTALGARAEDMFPEAWEAIGPLFEGVMRGGGATWAQDALVPLDSGGHLLERFFTFSFSPLMDDDGGIAGIIDIVADTTRQSQNHRRLQLLSHLAAAVADLASPADLPAQALPVLRSVPQDMPVVDVHLPDVPANRHGGLPARPSAAVDGRALVVEDDGAGLLAWMPLGGADRGNVPGSGMLVVRLSEHLEPTESYLDFLVLVAGTLTQAVDRARAREVERRSAQLQRELSETLQRSLLTRPVQLDRLEVAVRYRPSAEQAQIGGDWYDAFLTPAGTLTVAIGDVTGHDRHAAAAMAQVRNLLRGTSVALDAPPALVLAGLDRAMRTLAVDVLATAVLAQVEQDAEQATTGTLVLRWSNAGHPPPLLLTADGGARILETAPDLLLGLDESASRTDHTVTLDEGASLVLYTDGLVERRDTELQESLQQLRRDLPGRQHLSAEELCDHLLERLDADQEDDVAILVLRVRL